MHVDDEMPEIEGADLSEVAIEELRRRRKLKPISHKEMGRRLEIDPAEEEFWYAARTVEGLAATARSELVEALLEEVIEEHSELLTELAKR